MIRDKLLADLKISLEKLGVIVAEPKLEYPSEEARGDYSSNIAMVVFRVKMKPIAEFKNPLSLAQAIAANFPQTDYLEKVEAVSPGFVNFWLKPEYIYNSIDACGQTNLLKGQKIMVEFAQPNPFKEFHIGHLRNISLGESVCRLFEALGATIKRVNYEGDVGMHVAKALYGISFEGHGPSKLAKLKTLDEKIKFLGEAYAAGSKAFEEDEAAKKEIGEINKKIYAGEMEELYQTTKKWSLDYFETIYKRLGTKFDFYYFESVVGESGVKIVKEYLKKGVFEESEGAVVFKGEKYGLHTRVFLNSLGLPTYEAKDLSLPGIKYKDFSYDSSIIQTGNEQAEYFKVMLAALTMINPDLAAKTRNQTFGMVNLKSGKMSSRTGRVVTANWLLDEVKKKLQEAYKMEDEIAEIVAVAAVKYSMLKVNVTQDIAFDIEESVNLEGDSGPYLQYAYARTRSVLAKAKKTIEDGKWKVGVEDGESKIESKNLSSILNSQPLSSIRLSSTVNDNLAPEELSLLRVLYKFPEIVASAGKGYSPNLLCGYLFDLAGKFNSFYNKCSILNPEPQEARPLEAVREIRLRLTEATGQVLKNGLYLLGIKVVEKM